MPTETALPTLPARMLKWKFYGDGYDSLQVEETDVPTPGPNELLVRQDACGLCFSDTKVIGLGANHPRMAGRDLSSDPVTLGHEVSCTIVRIGENLSGNFQIGQRFIVQADVFYQGVSMAYGYAISGGLAEYSIIPQSMIEGDEGCYLLPLNPVDGYVETALVEPWACVVSAYNQAHRMGPKPGGRMLILIGSDCEFISFEDVFAAEYLPGTVTIFSPDYVVPSKIKDMLGKTNVEILDLKKIDWPTLKLGEGFDDILIIGPQESELIESAATLLANHGIMNFVCVGFDDKLTLDIGRIHYNWHYYLGSLTGNPMDSYKEKRTADILAGGTCWFIGAGGPMGQMHVQRAVQHKNPPRRIIATDIDDERLQSVVDRFGRSAEERGVELVTINPTKLTATEFDARLHELSDNIGFDDIVSLVPVASLIEHAADFLAKGGWFNIFAGVARGTMAQIDMNPIIDGGARVIGSSGSSIADMRETLSKVESGELSTNYSLAAIGGMRSAREGIIAVKEGRFPGKTLVFPLIPDLPLTPLADLEQSYPTVYAKLKDGQFWTKEAEEEFLRLNM